MDLTHLVNEAKSGLQDTFGLEATHIAAAAATHPDFSALSNCCLHNQSRKEDGQPESFTICSKFASSFTAIVVGLPNWS